MTPGEAFTRLQEKLEDRSVHVGIVGMGYVGLPLALTFAEAGVKVLGFDVDQTKVSTLLAGGSYLKHFPEARIAGAVHSQKMSATCDFTRLGEMDVIVIAVPTPLTTHRDPDMRYIEATAQAIAKQLRPGQLVILESTTYPGTTDGLLLSLLERDDCRLGEHFFLAFSPEREDPGNPDFKTATIPRVVGGVEPLSAQLAEQFYALAVDNVVPVESARAAEAVKLTENIFRAVNIALVNELKVVYEKMDIDVWDVLDAAATKPFGFMKFTPGPGLGGHCIPIDPFYLTWKAREYGLSTRFIELAGEVNLSMPGYVVERLRTALNDIGKAVKGARVLMLGVAYKKDVDDSRESPAFVLMDRLEKQGAIVNYHDPHVPHLPQTRAWMHLLPKTSTELTREALESHDVVLVATNHSSVDYDLVLQHAALVIDTRGIYRGTHKNVVKA